MPKDATKNIDRYKIRGGQLNEFDFQQNQEQFAENLEPQPDGLIPGTPPEKKATKAAKATKTIKPTKSTKTKKSAKPRKATKAAKASKATKSKPRGATAKKLAARKAAKK